MKRRIAQHLRHALLKRKRDLAERVLISTLSTLLPERIARIEESLKLSLRVRIVVAGETHSDLFQQLQSGDYWVKHELIKAFGETGCFVTGEEPDIVIHLFGAPAELPRNAYKIIWIYSHPNWVNPEMLRQYDKIFCLSPSFTEKINQMGCEAELMIGATAKRPVQREVEYDLVFVGNARPDLPHGRTIIQDIGETPYNFKVWGRGWENILPERYYAGQYFDNQRLDELYASSLISLNDHHEDMAREGFLTPRIFDILASGGFCISDRNSGIEGIFGDAVPQYRSARHLRELIDFYIDHPDERARLMEKGREIALSHTWRKRSEQFLGGIEGLKPGEGR